MALRCWCMGRSFETCALLTCHWEQHFRSFTCCTVPLLLHGSQINAWHFCGFVVPLLFSFAIPIPEVIQCYHLFLYVSDACELISWPPAVLVFRVVFWCLCVWCVVFSFLLFALLFCTVTAQWIMYRSCSVLFRRHIVVMIDVATALIRWICKMQLSFRLDKRPGESHLALDGKKTIKLDFTSGVALWSRASAGTWPRSTSCLCHFLPVAPPPLFFFPRVWPMSLWGSVLTWA